MNAYELANGGEHIAQANYSLDNQIRGYLMDMASMLRQQADRIAELEKAAQRMVDEFAPHADKCRPCTIEWQNLRSVLIKGMK